jgi:hypothetical protein
VTEQEHPTPSIGRIAHYRSHGSPVREDGSQAYASQCRAAVITEVWFSDPEMTTLSSHVGLCVLNPSGIFFHEACPHDEDTKRGGSWHWPCE